jgi:hypothetical protein
MRSPDTQRIARPIRGRAQVEALELNDVCWQTPEAFDDGQALFDAVCAHEL